MSAHSARTPSALVRGARRTDIPRVWELMRELAVYERMEDEHTSTPEQLAAQMFEADAWPKVECLVAEAVEGAGVAERAGAVGGAGVAERAGAVGAVGGVRAKTEIVGYALFYGCYSSFRGKPVIWLEDLCVTRTRRGTGAGMALMRALAAIAVERGCARLAWEVLDWNQPSIDFYERLGATRGNDWHTYVLAGKPLVALGETRGK